MGLLSWLENAGNSYLDRGVNASLAGVPPGLLNTAQTGIGPQPDGVAPMMTPQERKNLRMNYLMHLGQGISQGMPAAHLDDFRNDAIQSAVMRQQLQQQQQEQAALASAFAPQQTAPVLGGAAPPIAPPNGASAAPGVAAPVMGGAPQLAPASAVAPPPTAKPGDGYRRAAQAMTLRGKAEAALKFTEIADKMDKDATKENNGAPVFVSKDGKSYLHQGTKEGPGVDTLMDPSLKDVAETGEKNSAASKAQQDVKDLELKYYAQRAQDPNMTQDTWTALRGAASPSLQTQIPAMFSPKAAAALQAMGVSPDELSRENATANKPDPQTVLRNNYGRSFAKLQEAGLIRPADVSDIGKTMAAFKAAPATLISPEEKTAAIGYLGANPTIASQGTVANIRVEGLERSRMYPVIDKNTGNELMVSAAEMVDNPGKYAPAGTGSTAMQAGERFKTIQSNIDNVRKAVNTMGELPTGARIALANAMKSTDPKSAVDSLISSAAGKALSQSQRDFLNHITVLAESGNALAKMSGIPGNENTLAAVQALLPSAKSMDKKYMLDQLNSFQGLVTGLSKGVPRVLNSVTPAPKAATHRYNPATGKIEEIQ